MPPGATARRCWCSRCWSSRSRIPGASPPSAANSIALRADYILRPELRHFEADYAGGGLPSAHVQIGAKLVKMPERTIVAQQRIDTRAPARENQITAIVEAFNTALHEATPQPDRLGARRRPLSACQGRIVGR